MLRCSTKRYHFPYGTGSVGINLQRKWTFTIIRLGRHPVTVAVQVTSNLSTAGPARPRAQRGTPPPHTHTHTYRFYKKKKKTCELNCNSFKNLWFSERGWMLPITIKCDSCIMCINDTHSNTQCDIHRSLVFSSGCRVSHKQDCALCVWSLVSECEK